ncbi:MAG: zf-HC2 domain-containing protein [Candidatus Eremiobacteraeota bacterium]|nr:zf-HC2 domain-containing protein [Candidatus Eremiobacteraeota bacterium]
MTCKKPELSEKLVLYVEEQLSAEESGEIARHMEECESCREEAAFLGEHIGLIREGARFPQSRMAPCPDEGLLVDFVENPGGLAAGDRASITSHVEKCGDCQKAVSLLKEVASLGDEEKSPAYKVSLPAPLREAVARLYGPPKQSGIFQRIAAFFAAKPRYSILSALAAVLLLVGVLHVLFNDMMLRKSAEISPLVAPQQTAMVFRNEERGQAPQSSAASKKSSSRHDALKEKEPVEGLIEGEALTKERSLVVSASAGARKQSVSQPAALPDKGKWFYGSAPGQNEPSAGPGAVIANKQQPAPPATMTEEHDKLMSERAKEEKARDEKLDRSSEQCAAGDGYGGPRESGGGGMMGPGGGACGGNRGSGGGRGMTGPGGMGGGMAAPMQGMEGQKPQAPQGAIAGHDRSMARAGEREKLEHELTLRGQAYLDQLCGKNEALISVKVIPAENEEAFAVKKIEVSIRSTEELSRSLREKVARGVAERLSLKRERDTLKIEEHAVTY